MEQNSPLIKWNFFQQKNTVMKFISRGNVIGTLYYLNILYNSNLFFSKNIKFYFLVCIMILTIHIYCQDYNAADDTLDYSVPNKIEEFSDTNFSKKLYLKLGGGFSSINEKTWYPVSIESEIEYKYSPFFSNSISVGSGKCKDGTISFFEGNIDIGVSPFNIRRHLLKFSGGISYINYSEFQLTYRVVYKDTYIKDVYKIYNGDSFGINFNIEYMYVISKRLIAGINIFSRHYQNGYGNTGLLFKFGVKI